jgi:TolB-like protein/DNA-binding winged helix-turn-helix (wHTH) protein/Tfp pilus assembly protein PilF
LKLQVVGPTRRNDAIVPAARGGILLIPAYNFGDFELDGARFELRRHGRALKIERIPLELLILLAERNGNIVSRQEIVERLWGKDVFLDTEHGINTAVRKIRTALRDDAQRSRFIQTVSGKGYRFVAELVDCNPHVVTAVPAVETTLPANIQVSQSTTRHYWRMGAIIGIGLVLVAGAGLVFDVAGVRNRIFSTHRIGPIHSLAVLPLVNLSADSSQDYFVDGMTDEIITALAQNRSLRVVSRTSVMQYKGVRRPLRDVARKLGVDGILEGSVQRSRDRVHVTVQLIYAPSDTHVWAESYDRDLNEIFSLPSELSQTIAKQVNSAVLPASPQRYINPEAHDAYLHGRYFWFGDNTRRSQEYFEKAIQIQPDYAAAWSGLADTYLTRVVGMQVAPNEVMRTAEAAARKAVALDDSLVEVHTSLAGVYFFGNWDWKRADAETARAIALNPAYADVHPLRAYILAAMNRPDEALQEQRRSTELDSVTRPWALGKMLIHERQFDAALDELRLRAEAQPQDWYIQFLLSDAYWFKKMWKESVLATQRTLVLQGDKRSADAVRRAFESGGQKAVAEWLLKQNKAKARQEYVSPWVLALQTARLKRKAETLQLLEDSYRERSPWLVLMQHQPEFDFLHSDERYQALVKKMGLPPQTAHTSI